MSLFAEGLGVELGVNENENDSGAINYIRDWFFGLGHRCGRLGRWVSGGTTWLRRH